jgi:hypothetical protein
MAERSAIQVAHLPVYSRTRIIYYYRYTCGLGPFARREGARPRDAKTTDRIRLSRLLDEQGQSRRGPLPDGVGAASEICLLSGSAPGVIRHCL